MYVVEVVEYRTNLKVHIFYITIISSIHFFHSREDEVGKLDAWMDVSFSL